MATISVGGQTFDKAIDPAGYDKAISNLVSDHWGIPQSQQVNTRIYRLESIRSEISILESKESSWM